MDFTENINIILNNDFTNNEFIDLNNLYNINDIGISTLFGFAKLIKKSSNIEIVQNPLDATKDMINLTDISPITKKDINKYYLPGNETISSFCCNNNSIEHDSMNANIVNVNTKLSNVKNNSLLSEDRNNSLLSDDTQSFTPLSKSLIDENNKLKTWYNYYVNYIKPLPKTPDNDNILYHIWETEFLNDPIFNSFIILISTKGGRLKYNIISWTLFLLIILYLYSNYIQDLNHLFLNSSTSIIDMSIFEYQNWFNSIKFINKPLPNFPDTSIISMTISDFDNN